MHLYDSVAIIGVGLIGGSIGMALRERRLAREVVGIGRHETSLETARRVGAIDRGTTDLAEGVARANLVVVASPVDLIADHVTQAAAACPPDALITDAGSTKTAIVERVEQRLPGDRPGPRFIGSHPIAGDHRAGAEFARADLFVDRTVVVTPTARTGDETVQEVTRFWQALGGRVVALDVAAHDAALAATSHLPHLVAAALAAATPLDLLPLTAGGWRDTTRVAGGDPSLWRPIFATNRDHVLAALGRFEAQLAELRTVLAQADDSRFEQLLLDAKRTRDALGD